LEWAPKGWYGNPSAPNYNNGNDPYMIWSSDYYHTTLQDLNANTALGTGFKNTQRMLTNNPATGYVAATSGAGLTASQYAGVDGNTAGQWFLGSRDEVTLAMQSWGNNNVQLTGDWYNTSSDRGTTSEWIVLFNGSQNGCCSKWDNRVFRPMMAFGNVATVAPSISISNPAISMSVFSSSTNSYSLTNIGGEVVSFSISPALPRGLTLDTATGLITGIPLVAIPTTIETITATNAAGSSTATFSLTITNSTCAQGGGCSVGDIGPGGGIVFYVSQTPFTETGAACGAACHYLEWAPSGWYGNAAAPGYNNGNDPNLSWASDLSHLSGQNRNSNTSIGTGYANTQQLLKNNPLT
jgi:hypothetical protein